MTSLSVFYGDLPDDFSHDLQRRRKTAIKLMSRAFEELKLPELIDLGRSKDTIGQYRRSVRRWERFCESATSPEYRICNPVLQSDNLTQLLASLEVKHLDGFGRWLVTEIRTSIRERSKTLGDIQAILARAAAIGTGDLTVKQPPRVRVAKGIKAAPKLYFSFPLEDQETTPATLCDLDRLWRGCEVATWPRRSRSGRTLVPTREWRAAIVLYATYGFRTEELIETSASDSGLKWSQITDQVETPALGGHARNPLGWFWYVPVKQRWTKPEALFLPLTATCRQALESIRSDGPEDQVFAWPVCCKLFYAQWRAIVKAAGIKPVMDVQRGATIQWQIKHLRKTCSTWINHHFPGIGKMVTGHARRDVEESYYRNGELRVTDALAGLRAPGSWKFSALEAKQEVKADGSLQKSKPRNAGPHKARRGLGPLRPR